MDDQLSNGKLETALTERRAAKRFMARWPIRVRGLDDAGLSFEECGELANLSSGGALIQINRRLQVGSQMNVLIKVPLRGEKWMRYPAAVMREESGPGGVGAGVKFSTFRPQFVIE
jgi:hypothetical protein